MQYTIMLPWRFCSSHFDCFVLMWLAHHHEYALLAALCNIFSSSWNPFSLSFHTKTMQPYFFSDQSIGGVVMIKNQKREKERVCLNQRGKLKSKGRVWGRTTCTAEEGDINFLNMIMEGSKLRPNIMSKSCFWKLKTQSFHYIKKKIFYLTSELDKVPLFI